MSFNHHYPCSEVWAQGDLRRASCEAGRAACASEVFRLLELLPESLEWWKEGKVELCEVDAMVVIWGETLDQDMGKK